MANFLLDLGAAAKGISGGIEYTNKYDLAKKAYELDIERAKASQRQAFLDQSQKNLNENIKQVEKAVKGISAPTPGPVIASPDEQKNALIDRMESLWSQTPYGQANPQYVSMVANSLRNMPTGYDELQQKGQETRIKEEIKQEFETPKSDFLDESGNLKNEVSRQLYSMSTADFATLDPLTNEPRRNLTSKEMNVRNRREQVAARILKNKEAATVEDAMAIARSAVPFEGEPGISLPQKTKDEMLNQNTAIDNLIPKEQEILESAFKGTGLVSSGVAFADATLGQIIGWMSEGFTFSEENQQARQSLRLFNQEVKRSIVNSARFPKWEQEIVNGMLATPDEISQNPRVAVIKTKQLFDYLRNRRKENSEALGLTQVQSDKPEKDTLDNQVNSILGIQ
jgi:hypothetical protein